MKRNYLILIMLLSILQINAATIVVTNTNDAGAGSLRDVINLSNVGDVIRFSPSLIATGSDTIKLSSSISINEGVFIKGLYNATDTLYISGQNSTNILYVNLSNSGLKTLDIDSLVFINGSSASGGAISFANKPKSAIVIANSIFKNNNANNGGAISIEASNNSSNIESLSQATITNSIFINNVASNYGGAIYARGYNTSNDYDGLISINILNSTFSNNSAKYGGAIYAYASQNNSSGWAANPSANSSITVSKSTFANNTASFSGGAIYGKAWGALYVDRSDINVAYSTFVSNVAYTSGAAIYNACNDQYGIRAKNKIKSSMVALNTGSTSVYNDNSTSYNVSQGYNIFSSFSGSTQSTDQTGATLSSLNLGVLQYNGGFAPTMLPNAGSIAIDLGDPSNLSNAQNGPILGRRDVGAAESNFCSTPIIVNIGNVEICSGASYNFRGQTLSAAGNYSDTVQAIGGCDSIFNINLGVLNQATPTISITSSTGNNICSGASVTYTATITNGGTSPFYEWKRNGSTIGNGNTHTTPLINNGDVITCRLISSRSCLSANTITSNSITMNVNSSLTPSVSITVSPSNNIVFGTSTTFTANPTNGGTSPSYQWKVNGSNVGNNSATYTSSSLANGNVVTCQMTSNAQCAIPSSATSNSITMTVTSNLTNDEPCNATLLNVNNTCQNSYFDNTNATWSNTYGSHGCESNTNRDVWFKFVATSSNSMDVYTVAGGLTDGVMSLYEQNGNCSALFELGCIDDDGSNKMPQGYLSGLIIGNTYYLRMSGWGTNYYGTFGICVVDPNQTASVDDIEEASFDFNLYPNPATDILNIEFTDATTKNMQVKLYDMQGKMMQITPQVLENKIQLNVQYLAKGVYTLSVIKGDKVINKSIVVTK
jgi:hypothetical protein